MASAIASPIAWFATLLFLQPMIASGDFLSPLLSPILDDVCKHVECGKGTCKPSDNSTLSYECQCDAGWLQSPSNHDDHLKFIPCMVPNCTMDFKCTAAPAPVQDKASKANQSIFDPCFWTDCGGGSCNKTSKFAYKCACAEGYNNLLNISALPCYKSCAIGMDCSHLGISMSNSSSSPPALADNGNHATSILREKFHLLMALMMLLSMIQWI